MPYSASKPRIWLPIGVRDPISRFRTRWSACRSCCATVFRATKCMCGRLTASQIAAASLTSFFCDCNVLKLVGVSTRAKYVVFYSMDEGWESIDMPDAWHPQTLLAYAMNGTELP